MRLALGPTMSEIKEPNNGVQGRIGHIIVMQMLKLQSQTLTVLLSQIYAKGKFVGKVLRKLGCPKCCTNVVHQCMDPMVVVDSLETTFLPVLKNSTYYRIGRNDRGFDEAPEQFGASLYLTCDCAANIDHLWRENA